MSEENSGNFFIVRSSNLANAQMDEQCPARFGLRQDHIYETLVDLTPCEEVLCLSELRTCMDTDPDVQLHPTEIVHRIATRTGYSIAIAAPNNMSERSFWKATLYNRDLVKHLASGTINIDVPDLKHATNLLWSKFQWKSPESPDQVVYVINIHYPIKGQVKVARWFTDNITSLLSVSERDQVVFIGDCNTFMDIDGALQLETLKERFTMPEHHQITFKSFPHNDWQGESVLDHAGVLSGPYAAPATFNTYPVDHRYSDHAVVELRLQMGVYDPL